MAGILDFFTPEAGQRRTRALNQLTDDLTYYIPPELRRLAPALGLLEYSDAGDLVAMREAGNQFYDEPSVTNAIQAGAAGVGAALPVISSRMMSDGVDVFGDAVNSLGDDAGRVFRDLVDRLNQPGEVPTMYSNPIFGGGAEASQNAFGRPSQNIPRQVTENNVLSAVDRLSAEELAAAQPFTRTSGFAAPRVGGGRSRDPALFSDFSSKKQTGVPPSEWTVSGRSLPTSVQPPRNMNAEQFQREGFTDLTGFVADSTLGNAIIDEINGLRFPSPVMQQAGHAFGDNLNDLGFMSDAGALTSKTNAWGRMMDDGRRVAVTPMTMGTSGGDFSQHQAMNLVQAIRAAESQIDPNFIPLVGAAKNNNRLLPEGMGLLSPELPEYLMSLNGSQRAAFVKALDTSPALAPGVPSVGAVRWATMDPNLIDQPTLSSGYRVFEPDLADRELRDFFVYPENHGSYDAAIQRVGENMTMGAPRPWTIQFPDEAYGKIMDSTPSGSNMPMVAAMPKDLRSFQMNPNLSQIIDDQWVDANMRYDEILRERGREQADLYAIDAMMNRATLAGR